MTRGMQIYAAALLVLVVFLFIKLVYIPADVRAVNQRLNNDQSLADYPYQFRVLRIDNGKAYISSPRSANVSVLEIIRVIYPELADVSVTDERFQEAQKELVEHQALAHVLVMSAPEVSSVGWQLDEAWLRNNGVLP